VLQAQYERAWLQEAHSFELIEEEVQPREWKAFTCSGLKASSAQDSSRVGAEADEK